MEEMETGDMKTGDVRRENWIDYGMEEFESMLQEDISANIYPYRPSIPPMLSTPTVSFLKITDARRSNAL